MRGYITQEERLRMQQMSASTDIKQKLCSSKNWFYKIELGIIVILTVFSALFIYPCLDSSIRSIGWMYEDPDDWTFIEIYGKGFIPGLLLSVTALIGNIILLCKKQNGFWFMSLLSLPIILPTILNEYEEILCFTPCIFSVMFAYYVILRIPNSKKSYWCNIKQGSSYLRNICIAIWIVFIGFIVTTPFVLSKEAGCVVNFFSNGQDIFNAKYGDSKSYYCHSIAKKMAGGIDFITSNGETKAWFEMAIANLKYSHFKSDYYYLDYADFLESIGEYEEAYKLYKKANQLFNTDDTSQKLNGFLNEHSEFDI